MRVVRVGGRQLFERDAETSKYVAAMLQELEQNGMDAVRQYSRDFDDWERTLRATRVHVCACVQPSMSA